MVVLLQPVQLLAESRDHWAWQVAERCGDLRGTPVVCREGSAIRIEVR